MHMHMNCPRLIELKDHALLRYLKIRDVLESSLAASWSVINFWHFAPRGIYHGGNRSNKYVEHKPDSKGLVAALNNGEVCFYLPD